MINGVPYGRRQKHSRHEEIDEVSAERVARPEPIELSPDVEEVLYEFDQTKLDRIGLSTKQANDWTESLVKGRIPRVNGEPTTKEQFEEYVRSFLKRK